MPLIYSFVARGTTVLAEYAAYNGNFESAAVAYLEQQQNADGKFTQTADHHTFHFLSAAGYTFLVVADVGYGRTIPSAFLERIRDDFMSGKYAERAKTADAHSLDKSFGPRLKAQMDYCMANPQEIDKTFAVQQKIEEVKGIMHQNIQAVLNRGENLDALNDKTEHLQNNATTFAVTAKKVKSKMWWQNFRMQLILIVVVVLLALIIFLAACFSNGQNCTKRY